MDSINNPFRLEPICAKIKAERAEKAKLEAKESAERKQITDRIAVEYYNILKDKVLEQIAAKQHATIIYENDKPVTIAYQYIGDIPQDSPLFISDDAIIKGFVDGNPLYTKRFIPSIVDKVVEKIGHELVAAEYVFEISENLDGSRTVNKYSIPARMLE